MLVKVAEQEQKTKGGILLPVAAQKRPTSGQHVAVAAAAAALENYNAEAEAKCIIALAPRPSEALQQEGCVV